MKAGIVICTRLNSSRVPRKALAPLNGVPVLAHLIHRLIPTGLPIVLAVPPDDLEEYRLVFADHPQVWFFAGYPTDPLKRMAAAASMLDLDVVVRVNHDKIFVDPRDVWRLLNIFEKSTLDYIYSSTFVPGTGFEVISFKVLAAAAEKFDDVEHISYAVHALTKRKTDVDIGFGKCPHRLLIDYPEDMTVLGSILKELGEQCELDAVLAWLDKNPMISRVNRLPLVTIYTCGFNAEAWVEDAILSVLRQKGMEDFEYILVDDASVDLTGDLMASYKRDYARVSYIRNYNNLGLASSCNVALSRARGKYVMRLDADDYLCGDNVVANMAAAIEASAVDILYPDHYLGSMHTVEKGHVHHHAGGAMFSTRALNHLKFTDGLRGFEGYDLFERASQQLRIGYYEKPTFFYRQHEHSMSKSDPAARAEIKKSIDERIGNESQT